MKVIYCSNCGKKTGHKRALGWGTFLGAILTCGVLLLMIPLYPKRCIICGAENVKIDANAPVASSPSLKPHEFTNAAAVNSSFPPRKWYKSGGGITFLTIMAIGILGAMVNFISIHFLGKSYPERREQTQVRSSSSEVSEWLPLCMNVWPGVKVYYGRDKTYWGTVLDFNDDYVIPGTGERIRAVKVLMSNGSAEWKNREAVICDGYRMGSIQLFVKRNDPVLK